MPNPDFRLGVISDTHGNLHPDIFQLFKGVDLIVHAGDLVNKDHLVELESLAPVEMVHGNCDPGWQGIEPLRMPDLPFGKLILTHSHLQPDNLRNPAGLAKHFETNQPRMIVFGHTHIQVTEWVGETLVLNPGAAGKPRFRDIPSLATVHWHESSDTLDVEIHQLDWSNVSSA